MGQATLQRLVDPSVTAPTIVVTRPEPQASEWVHGLQLLGQAATAFPLLQIEPDPAVATAWSVVPQQAAVFFVSPAAVAAFFDACPEPHLPWPAGVVAAAPGPGTARLLEARGVPAALIVSPPPTAAQFDSEALWPLLAVRAWQGQSVLVVRGQGGRDWLAQQWAAAGARVLQCSAYRRSAPVLTPEQQATLQGLVSQPAAVCWLFSSSEAVAHLQALAPGIDWASAQAIATHPRIAEAAQAIGFRRVHRCTPQPAAVCACLLGPLQGGLGEPRHTQTHRADLPPPEGLLP